MRVLLRRERKNEPWVPSDPATRIYVAYEAQMRLARTVVDHCGRAGPFLAAMFEVHTGSVLNDYRATCETIGATVPRLGELIDQTFDIWMNFLGGNPAVDRAGLRLRNERLLQHQAMLPNPRLGTRRTMPVAMASGYAEVRTSLAVVMGYEQRRRWINPAFASVAAKRSIAQETRDGVRHIRDTAADIRRGVS